jgi:uncharacterized protein YciI
MTDDEDAVWSQHFERLKRLVAEGVVVMAGPTWGSTNTGIVVFEADDEAAAKAAHVSARSNRRRPRSSSR